MLIDAARGEPPFDRVAFDYLDDSNRIYLTSPYVRLETVPKAAYMQRKSELQFYHQFFNNPQLEWCRDWQRLEQLADEEAIRHGLGALDALHVAAAYLLNADELVTVERPTKALYRSRLVRVVYLYAGVV